MTIQVGEIKKYFSKISKLGISSEDISTIYHDGTALAIVTGLTAGFVVNTVNEFDPKTGKIILATTSGIAGAHTVLVGIKHYIEKYNTNKNKLSTAELKEIVKRQTKAIRHLEENEKNLTYLQACLPDIGAFNRVLATMQSGAPLKNLLNEQNPIPDFKPEAEPTKSLNFSNVLFILNQCLKAAGGAPAPLIFTVLFAYLVLQMKELAPVAAPLAVLALFLYVNDIIAGSRKQHNANKQQIKQVQHNNSLIDKIKINDQRIRHLNEENSELYRTVNRLLEEANVLDDGVKKSLNTLNPGRARLPLTQQGLFQPAPDEGRGELQRLVAQNSVQDDYGIEVEGEPRQDYQQQAQQSIP